MKERIQQRITKGKETAKHIDKKLRRRLLIFVIIMLIMTSMVIYNLIIESISPVIVISGLIAGGVLGLIAGRMFKISRDPEVGQVVARIDMVGGIFLAVYVAFEVGKKWIFGYRLQGAQLHVFGLIFLTGIFMGRLIMMTKSIQKVLYQEDKLS